MRALALCIPTVLVLASLTPAGARCLDYDPASVTLSGKLESRVLPGPPNYKSLARGDVPETVYILVLSQPICVKGDPTRSLTRRSHAGVGEVQLAMDGAKGKHLVGRAVKATGSLRGAQSGHHRTPVVLGLRAIRAAE